MRWCGWVSYTKKGAKPGHECRSIQLVPISYTRTGVKLPRIKRGFSVCDPQNGFRTRKWTHWLVILLLRPSCAGLLLRSGCYLTAYHCILIRIILLPLNCPAKWITINGLWCSVSTNKRICSESKWSLIIKWLKEVLQYKEESTEQFCDPILPKVIWSEERKDFHS